MAWHDVAIYEQVFGYSKHVLSYFELIIALTLSIECHRRSLHVQARLHFYRLNTLNTVKMYKYCFLCHTRIFSRHN